MDTKRDFEETFAQSKEVTDFYRVFAGTQIKTIPAKLFAGNKLVRSFNCAFQYCSNMESIPVSIFDENRRVTDFSGVFSWDYPNLQRQESPYTVVNGKKVHLYERENYPDDFVEPTSTSSALSAFANYNWGLENIPSAWR